MKILLSTLLVSMIFISCKKEGCTDSDAINFDPEATVKDYSCNYESTITFWFDQQTSNSYLQSGVSTIRVYLQDVLIGSLDATDYIQSKPECMQTGTISKLRALGGSKSGIFDWEVRDENDSPLQYGTWYVEGNVCHVEKLVY